MRRAARVMMLACALAGCARKQDACAKDDALSEAKRVWRAKWRKARTYELAEEFLRLYGGDTYREADSLVSDGVELHQWKGHAANLEMPIADIESILGKFDYSTDHTHNYVLKVSPEEKPDAWDPKAYMAVEDIVSQGVNLTEDMMPVEVEVLKYAGGGPMPLGGTGTTGE